MTQSIGMNEHCTHITIHANERTGGQRARNNNNNNMDLSDVDNCTIYIL